MDLGVGSLEGLVGPDDGVSAEVVGDTETNERQCGGSGFSKQERYASGEDEWRSFKTTRTDCAETSNAMLHLQGTSLLRSNSMLSHDAAAQTHTILSFSLPKSEVPFLNKYGELVGKSTQTPPNPYYQHAPYAYTRNAGYGSGGFNLGMHGSFGGCRGPFTSSQWIELEHQALIYKYIMANVPVPSNLLMALKKSLNPFVLSGASTGCYASNSYGWGSFHLGLLSNTDPEPGRCRRTDGKKWRCSWDAVADQKYCERHINRGRHRSRKHVEGHTGHAVTGCNTSGVAPISSMTASVLSSDHSSNNSSITQHQFSDLQFGAASPSMNTLITRAQDTQGPAVISPTIDAKAKGPSFSLPEHVSIEESSQMEFGLASSDSLLNPSQKSSCLSSRNYNSFMDFNGQETHKQHPLHQFIDDLPKDQCNRSTIAWPEELKSDWTQLSMSFSMTSANFSSTSSSPRLETLALSPLRLSHEHSPIKMDVGLSGNLREPTEKQINSVPTSWGSSMGGPLGEVLNNTTSNGNTCRNSSVLNLTTEMWDGSPQFRSSPTGVLHKTTFISLSNSCSGCSPIAEQKTNEHGSLCNDMLASTLASSFSVPSFS